MKKEDSVTGRRKYFSGVWIDKIIYLSNSLTWTEKLLLIEIDSLSISKNGCDASNEYFASFFDKSVNTITKAISKLKSLNLIKLTKFDGRKRFLKTNDKIKETLSRLSEEEINK